jgi:hypothetical protein
VTGPAFGLWLTQQTSRDDATGELARHYVTPCPCTPCGVRTSRRYSVNGVRAELQDHAAGRAALDALDAAAQQWQASRTHHPSKARQE